MDMTFVLLQSVILNTASSSSSTPAMPKGKLNIPNQEPFQNQDSRILHIDTLSIRILGRTSQSISVSEPKELKFWVRLYVQMIGIQLSAAK